MSAGARRRPVPRRWRRRWAGWRDPAGIASALALLAAALALSDWTWRLDRVIYDRALSSWTRPAPADITIVAIDDASIAAIGRWPWPRNVHATLLDRLAEARPRAVLLDLVLSEPDRQPASDALLARAMRKAAPLVLPVPWLSVNGRRLRWLEPAPPFVGAAQLASAEATPDADGVVRHVFLRAGAPGQMRSHSALALLEAAGDRSSPRLRPESGDDAAPTGQWQRDQRLLLRYGGPPGHVRRVSYVDLLTGTVPAASLRGHYVLIGMTAQGLGDALATPVNGYHQAMPGVEVLAQTLQMLRSGDGLWPLPDAWLALGSALLAAIGVLLLSRLGLRTALVASLGSALGALLASIVAVGFGVWASPVPLMAAALLVYPLLSWRRLETAVSGLDREIRALAADTGKHPSPLAERDPIDARLRRLHAAGTMLREARRFLADVLASLPNGTLVADDHARVLNGNAQAAALFEVGAADELQGLDLARLLGEFATDESVDWAATLASIAPGGSRPAFPVRLRGHGDYVVQLAAAALAGERRVLAVIADVAPVKAAERQREEALAFVSHDLRSPATSIALLADLALGGASPPDLLPEVRRLAQRLLSMSEDFVRYTHADLVALAPTRVDMRQLLERAVRDLRPQAAAAGIAIEATPHDASATATLDAELVARAVGNLVSNALRHSPAGETVRVRTAAEGRSLVIRVSDHGSGMSPAQREQLQAGHEGLRGTGPRGIGLGLRFVQRVARRHGGMLRLPPPEDDRGTIVELVLPL